VTPEVRPFKWTGTLGGFLDFTPDDPADPWDNGNLREWAIEAQHLVTFCHDAWPDVPVSLVAHSHGGALATLAIAYGLKARHLITVATPPRHDMAAIYGRAKSLLAGEWWHLYGDWHRDWMIKLGQLGDGAIGWRRKIYGVDRLVHVPGAGHSDLLRPLHLVETGVVDLLGS
jgi:pimeloyl-ACP methyl ester carboxylesterase